MAPCEFVDQDEGVQDSLVRHPEIEDKLKAILAEYQTLRAEILLKQQLQHHLFQFHVLALTAIIAAIFIPSGLGLWALFLIPIESSIIGIWYVDHDTGIIKIGNYIQTFIEPRVCSVLHEEKIMNWENFVRVDAGTHIIGHQYFKIRISRLLSFLAFEVQSIFVLLAIVVISITHISEIPVMFKMEPIYIFVGWIIGFIITLFLFLFERNRYNVVDRAY